jgi:hypothetical protein
MESGCQVARVTVTSSGSTQLWGPRDQSCAQSARRLGVGSRIRADPFTSRCSRRTAGGSLVATLPGTPALHRRDPVRHRRWDLAGIRPSESSCVARRAAAPVDAARAMTVVVERPRPAAARVELLMPSAGVGVAGHDVRCGLSSARSGGT